jgi:hypothetical protein
MADGGRHPAEAIVIDDMPDGSRSTLHADCSSCFALCCVALPFSASADFAIDKPAGRPCPHLRSDFHCGIHDRLRPRGFSGCTAYDCFGGGQKVSRLTFGGHGWRDDPRTAAQMVAVFPIMRQLHELLWYLTEALTLHAARSLHTELRVALEETERLTCRRPDGLRHLDVAAHRDTVNPLLLAASEAVRAEVGSVVKNLHGADLTGAIFLTQSQLTAALGDVHTTVGLPLTRPAHWLPSGS